MRGHDGRRTGRGATAVAIALLSGGCTLLPAAAPTPADPAPLPRVPSTSTASTAPAPTRTAASAGLPSTAGVPSAFPSPAAPRTPRPSGPAGLRAREVVVDGSAGSLSWTVQSVRFSGGAGAGEVNRRVRAAVDDAVRRGEQEARRDDGRRRRITGTSEVTTNDGRTVQVNALFVDALEGTAHPSYHVATTAVTTGAGRPILVSELFRDERAAFRALAREVRRTAAEEGEPVSADGLEPRRTNWDNWQTSSEGLTIVFDDYQLGGHGTRSCTVSWSVVEPLMTRAARRLLAPS